jgi:myo-inositol-1(or 4)-monophosphatase
MALVATGFGYAAERRRKQAQVLGALLPKIRDIRRGGSAAIDLCTVAEGSVNAYYEQGVHPWDWGAGALIAEEAGARVAGLRGTPPNNAMLVAAPPGLFEPLHDLLVSLEADRDA